MGSSMNSSDTGGFTERTVDPRAYEAQYGPAAWARPERDDEGVRVSVVIPCHNCADTIGEQLGALGRQSSRYSWEVVVVDNDSDDDLAAALEPHRRRVPGLRRIEANERAGAGYARNAGARAARGDYLLFVDADDVVSDGWLAAMTGALEEHSFVAASLEHERLNSTELANSRDGGQEDDLRPYKNPRFLPHASGNTLGVRRSVHEAIGGFSDQKNLQDTEYCWRAQLRGVPLTFVPDAVVHYRYRESTRAVFRQAFWYGYYNVRLYRTFRGRGMPRANWRFGAIKWRNLIRDLPAIADPQRRLRLLRRFGFQLGRLVGCVRFGALAL